MAVLSVCISGELLRTCCAFGQGLPSHGGSLARAGEEPRALGWILHQREYTDPLGLEFPGENAKYATKNVFFPVSGGEGVATGNSLYVEWGENSSLSTKRHDVYHHSPE